MKTSELRDLSQDELKKKLGDLRRELLSLRIKNSSQQLKNPLKLREVRRSVARVLTIIKEKSK